MLGSTISEAVDKSKELAKHSYEYYKLKLFEQTAYFSSQAFKILMTGGLIFMGIVFLAISSAFFLNEQMDSAYVGFIIMAGFLFILAGIIYLFREKIENLVVKKLSKNYFKDS